MSSLRDRAAAPRQAERSRTADATEAKRILRDFNHLSAHIMDADGYSIGLMADILELSESRVYALLAEPCPEYEAEQERKEAKRTKLAQDISIGLFDAPFCKPDDFLTKAALKAKGRRAQIRYLLSDDVRKAEIARRLGISRQLVQYYQGQMFRDEPTPDVVATVHEECPSYVVKSPALLKASHEQMMLDLEADLLRQQEAGTLSDRDAELLRDLGSRRAA